MAEFRAKSAIELSGGCANVRGIVVTKFRPNANRSQHLLLRIQVADAIVGPATVSAIPVA